MEENVSQEEFDRLAKIIQSADSPVGIDATKTHIIIINKLNDIINRLERLEAAQKKES